MNMNETKISKAPSGKALIVTRDVNAPVDAVWRAWTESELLDKWWAPKPWKAVTKRLDFTEGGQWFYKMTGPDGNGQWCLVDFGTIDPGKSFTATSAFADEGGNKMAGFPNMYWKNEFTATATGTTITVEMSFDSEAELEQIVGMGFKEGFTMALGNLDELLA